MPFLAFLAILAQQSIGVGLTANYEAQHQTELTRYLEPAPIAAVREHTIALEPGIIFQVHAMAIAGERTYCLDKDDCTVAVFGPDGAYQDRISGRGQGPGEFTLPRALTVSGDKLFVSDMGAIKIFDAATLKFRDSFKIANNPSAITAFKDEVFVGMTIPGESDYGIFVFDSGGVQQRKMYTVPAEQRLKNPYFTMKSSGELMVLNRCKYEVLQQDFKGGEPEPLQVQPAPQYRPIVPIEPFDQKYGQTLASALRWRLEWSEPRGIALVENKYLWLCFDELQPDLVSHHYFVEVFELNSMRKCLTWHRVKGPLLAGGKFAWFFEESQSVNVDSPSHLVPYQLNQEGIHSPSPSISASAARGRRK